MGSPSFSGKLTGHGGNHAVEVARHNGVDTIFTLSGGHVFPIYDGAVKADPPMRLLDVRHEQTAVFAAEAVGKLTRRAGCAGSHRRPRGDQRGERSGHRTLQRLSPSRHRWTSPRQPLGAGPPPGTGSAPAIHHHHQTRVHGP